MEGYNIYGIKKHVLDEREDAIAEIRSKVRGAQGDGPD